MHPTQFVIAIDSFKGSLSSLDAGRTVEKAVHAVFPAAKTTVFPLADGGEGTVETLVLGLGGATIPVTVTGPLGKKIPSRFGCIERHNLAIIEMADAAGLPRVPKKRRNPLFTTTYGLGELILAAAKSGCRDFLIGLGGSATNDGGLGMMTALGARFTKKDGTPCGIFGKDVADVAAVDLSHLAPVLRECHFSIACDVTNPLTGERGCSAVFGPQKGATPDIVQQMDAALGRYAGIVEAVVPSPAKKALRFAEQPGAGAAGGLGFAFSAFLGSTLTPGIELVLDLLGIDEALKAADVLLTGEGRMDAQSVMGKAPVGTAQRAKRWQPGITTIALCGCTGKGAAAVNACGIDAYFPIIPRPMAAAEAMEKAAAKENLEATAVQVLRLLARN